MRVMVKNFGCSANVADGEVLAGCLSQAGFELTDSIQQADVIVYNTCSVKF
jgi:tRNA-2-methylthio-N6-dimethylallyladenosine synthase